MEKKKLNILYIGGRIYPTLTANSINSVNVIEELINKGHNVTYIALNQDKNFDEKMLGAVNVYSIKNNKFGKLLDKSRECGLSKSEQIKLRRLTFIRKIRNVIQLFKFPDVEPKQSLAAFRLAEDLHMEFSFDTIIGVFRSFTGVSATIMMKEKYPELICGAYYLDLIRGSKKPSFLPNNLYQYLIERGEIKAFSKLDFILMPKTGKATYSSYTYKNINNKIKYVDFPLFKVNNIDYSNCLYFEKKSINLVFAGLLDRNYRNPEFMLKVLEIISKGINNIVLHIYGRGNCNDIINKYKDTSSYKIIHHGMVSHDEVLCALNKSDFLINISNKMHDMVPSKIFELFSTGKPIINFISNKNDASLEYFDKYPSECRILEWGILEDESKRVLDYIQNKKGIELSKEEIKQNFIENTPEFTADIFEKTINDFKFKNNM